ncbi:hypothetical protein JCM10207_003735 [Rhodosporidiobolus poonsookiae]
MSTSLAVPAMCPQLVSTLQHDLYPSISPEHALKDAARGLSVLVTGSGRGIGRAEAIAFARAGAKKVVLTSRSRAQLAEVKQRIEELEKGTEVVIVESDITSEEAVDKLFAQAGEVDVLINNAGFGETCRFIRDSNPADWRRALDINVMGTYLPTRAFLRAAHARGAQGKKLTVINTSSIGSTHTLPRLSCYQSNKSMINRFTEFLHFEEPDVRTFAIHPGGVDTQLARSILPEEVWPHLVDTPELAGGFVLWLATQDSADFLRGRYISANWDVDEVLAKKDEIVAKDLLWTRVAGQEQVMPK